MIDIKTTKLAYKDVRDDVYLALKALLDLPLKPDAMTEPVAFNNVKVARQRLRNHLDDMLIEKHTPDGGCQVCGKIIQEVNQDTLCSYCSYENS